MVPEASTLAALICTLGKCARVLLALEAAAMAGSADRTANRAFRSVNRSDDCPILIQVYSVDCSVIRPWVQSKLNRPYSSRHWDAPGQAKVCVPGRDHGRRDQIER